MIMNGPVADPEPVGDLLDQAALAEEHQDLVFARCEFGQLPEGWARRQQCGELLKVLPDMGSDLFARYCSGQFRNGRKEIGRGSSLQHVNDRAAWSRFKKLISVFEN